VSTECCREQLHLARDASGSEEAALFSLDPTSLSLAFDTVKYAMSPIRACIPAGMRGNKHTCKEGNSLAQ